MAERRKKHINTHPGLGSIDIRLTIWWRSSICHQHLTCRHIKNQRTTYIGTIRTIRSQQVFTRKIFFHKGDGSEAWTSEPLRIVVKSIAIQRQLIVPRAIGRKYAKLRFNFDKSFRFIWRNDRCQGKFIGNGIRIDSEAIGSVVLEPRKITQRQFSLHS